MNRCVNICAAAEISIARVHETAFADQKSSRFRSAKTPPPQTTAHKSSNPSGGQLRRASGVLGTTSSKNRERVQTLKREAPGIPGRRQNVGVYSRILLLYSKIELYTLKFLLVSCGAKPHLHFTAQPSSKHVSVSMGYHAEDHPAGCSCLSV